MMWNNIIIAEIVFSVLVGISSLFIPVFAKKKYDKITG